MGRETLFAQHLASNSFGGALGSVLFEPQRAYNFSVEIDLGKKLLDLGAANFGGTNFGNIGVPSVEQAAIELTLDSAFLPRISFDEVKVRDVNKEVYLAGYPSTESGKLVCRDTIGLPIMNTIHSWLKSVYDFDTDQPGVPDIYKKTAHILLLGPFGAPERIWELKGVWPKSIDFGSLSMEGSEIVRMTLDLRYDSAIYLGSIELGALQSAITALK